MLKFDHLAIACSDLDAAQVVLEATFGVPLQAGGQHAAFGTYNRLLSLGPEIYLELIAIDPGAPAPGRARWFDLDNFSGAARVTNWIVQSDDIDATLAAIGPEFGAPVALRRDDLVWSMAVPADGKLPYDNCAPALIEWGGATHPAPRLTDQGCRLHAFTVRHPEAAQLAALLAPHLAGFEVLFEVGPAALVATLMTPGGLVVLPC